MGIVDAVILAAGNGKRLHGEAGGVPKCLLEVGGVSILHRQIVSCLSVDIERIHIVVGNQADAVRQHANIVAEGVVRCVENSDFERTNTLHSLWLALASFESRPFLLFNGDVVAREGAVLELMRHEGESCLLVTDHRCGEEEMKTSISDGTVRQVSKSLSPSSSAGEFIGIAKFSLESSVIFRRELERLVLTGRQDLYFEEAMIPLFEKNMVRPCIIGENDAIEIDFPADLARAQVIFGAK